ncbi:MULTISPECIES: DUF1418 family protein [Pantoea]|jgi:Protein of unknown function (DUF1418).|uniref:DUF1418 family protein n=2 Tax=Pantoea TaxID=53335 RepID=A0A0U3KWU8_9GAMM|nr:MULTISPECIES: DUF1418 family protein [Pantoea]ALV92875.1 hypothetical protein LK04_12270 [Pantoea vagans]KHJ65530.1 hypothetical protein QU24_23955 [Pantoea rodasii]MDI9222971.1 DUF1418 family protein [Pantoea sp. EA-12]
MRNLATLPKPILLLEVLGVLSVIGALLLVNDWVSAPAFMAKNSLATLLFFLGIALMLPAAWLMMWRTAKAMAPQLFNQTHKKK